MGERRDPTLNPRAGDLWRGGNRTIEVHAVKDGWVYFGVPDSFGGGKMPLAEFAEEARKGEYLGGNHA